MTAQILLALTALGSAFLQVDRPDVMLALEYRTGFIGHNWLLTVDRSGVVEEHVLTTGERFWLRQLNRAALAEIREALEEAGFAEMVDLPAVSEDAPRFRIIAELPTGEHSVTVSDPCFRLAESVANRFSTIWDAVIGLAGPLRPPRRDPDTMTDGRCEG